ncbi:MAG: hypothetical protein HGA27_08425, partial [Peptococcaceae bacterium]|nr:hypothetical protein [Peptococcaceae bacterium]
MVFRVEVITGGFNGSGATGGTIIDGGAIGNRLGIKTGIICAGGGSTSWLGVGGRLFWIRLARSSTQLVTADQFCTAAGGIGAGGAGGAEAEVNRVCCPPISEVVTPPELTVAEPVRRIVVCPLWVII